jgi:hypothetical protein
MQPPNSASASSIKHPQRLPFPHRNFTNVLSTPYLCSYTQISIMAHLFDTPGSNQTIKWQSDSNTRGTFSIISSCTITLVLGVYSAVHLNLPGRPGSFTEAFLRRFAWILCSLLAPEALILVAYRQRQAAKRISKKVNEVFGAKSKTAVSHDQNSERALLTK